MGFRVEGLRKTNFGNRIRHAQANKWAFAARRSDKTVVTWGDPERGGLSTLNRVRGWGLGLGVRGLELRAWGVGLEIWWLMLLVTL